MLRSANSSTSRPLRVLRFRVDAPVQECLQQVAWWDWSHEQIDAAQNMQTPWTGWGRIWRIPVSSRIFGPTFCQTQCLAE